MQDTKLHASHESGGSYSAVLLECWTQLPKMLLL